MRRANSLVLMSKDYIAANGKVEALNESMEKAKAKRWLGAEMDLDEPTGQPNIDRQLKVAMRVALGSHVALRNQVIVYWNAINRKYPSGDALLHICCREGYAKMVDFIIDPKNHTKKDTMVLDVNSRNRKNRTPMHVAFTPPQATFIAKKHGFGPTGELQSEMPEDVQMVVDFVPPGKRAEREEIIKMLLDAGADPNDPDYHDYCPLHMACLYGWLDTVVLLAEKGARVDAGNIAGETPLMLAAQGGFLEIVEYLTEEADPPATVNVKDTNEAMALHYAVKANHKAIAEHLLELGAEPDQRSLAKDTPLRLACQNNNLEMVHALLDLNVVRDKEAFALMAGEPKEQLQRRIAMEEREAREAAEAQAAELKEAEERRLEQQEQREQTKAQSRGTVKVKPFPKTAYGQWVPYIDKVSGRIFYYNKVSRVTQWEMPKDYVKDKLHVMKKATFGMHFYH